MVHSRAIKGGGGAPPLVPPLSCLNLQMYDLSITGDVVATGLSIELKIPGIHYWRENRKSKGKYGR